MGALRSGAGEPRRMEERRCARSYIYEPAMTAISGEESTDGETVAGRICRRADATRIAAACNATATTGVRQDASRELHSSAFALNLASLASVNNVASRLSARQNYFLTARWVAIVRRHRAREDACHGAITSAEERCGR